MVKQKKILFFMFLFPAFLAISLLLINASAFAIGQIGIVSELGGQAVVVRQQVTLNLQLNAPIFQNDVITTDETGSLKINFVDDTIFTLSPNSQIVVDEMVYDPASESGSQIFSMIKGKFLFVSGKIAKTDPGDMRVNAGNATIGIRGTVVTVEVSPEVGTIISLIDGAIGLQYDGQGDVVILDKSFEVATNRIEQNGSNTNVIRKTANEFVKENVSVLKLLSPAELSTVQAMVQESAVENGETVDFELNNLVNEAVEVESQSNVSSEAPQANTTVVAETTTTTTTTTTVDNSAVITAEINAAEEKAEVETETDTGTEEEAAALAAAEEAAALAAAEEAAALAAAEEAAALAAAEEAAALADTASIEGELTIGTTARSMSVTNTMDINVGDYLEITRYSGEDVIKVTKNEEEVSSGDVIFIDTIENTIDTYTFQSVKWGTVSAGGADIGIFTASDSFYFMDLMKGHWILGGDTISIDILPTSGTADFVGSLFGDYTENGSFYAGHITGSVSMTIAFTDNSISGNMDFYKNGSSWLNSTISGSLRDGAEYLVDGFLSVDGVTSGNLFAKLFSIDDGAEIGGSWYISDGIGEATGVFAAYDPDANTDYGMFTSAGGDDGGSSQLTTHGLETDSLAPQVGYQITKLFNEDAIEITGATITIATSGTILDGETYEYVSWGTWTSGFDEATLVYADGGENNLLTTSGLWYVGDSFSGDLLPTTGTAYYAGSMIGDHVALDGTESKNAVTGNINYTFDFATVNVSGEATFLNNGASWFTATFNDLFDDIYFSTNLIASEISAGGIHGTLMGHSSQAIPTESAGTWWFFTNDGSGSAAGIYLAKYDSDGATDPEVIPATNASFGYMSFGSQSSGRAGITNGFALDVGESLDIVSLLGVDGSLTNTVVNAVSANSGVMNYSNDGIKFMDVLDYQIHLPNQTYNYVGWGTWETNGDTDFVFTNADGTTETFTNASGLNMGIYVFGDEQYRVLSADLPSGDTGQASFNGSLSGYNTAGDRIDGYINFSLSFSDWSLYGYLDLYTSFEDENYTNYLYAYIDGAFVNDEIVADINDDNDVKIGELYGSLFADFDSDNYVEAIGEWYIDGDAAGTWVAQENEDTDDNNDYHAYFASAGYSSDSNLTTLYMESFNFELTTANNKPYVGYTIFALGENEVLAIVDSLVKVKTVEDTDDQSQTYAHVSWGRWEIESDLRTPVVDGTDLGTESGTWIAGALHNAPLPTSGTATYAGSVYGDHIATDGTETKEAITGTSNFIADFATDMISGSLIMLFNNVDWVDATMASTAIQDADIGGASFNGALTGANVTSGSATGNFYGDSIGDPSSVGGSFNVTATDGSSAAGVFVAQ